MPACITDDELQNSAKYRSKERLPVVTWFDPTTGCSIARCSQVSGWGVYCYDLS